MSTPQVEVSLVETLRRNLTFGERILSGPKVEAPHVLRWQRLVRQSLLKIYGRDAELINTFNDIPDKALLLSDPKLCLQRLMAFVARLCEAITNDASLSLHMAFGGINKIFVGHGRNPVWSRVVNHLKDELALDVETFEMESRTSEHVVDVLRGFLSSCDAAVIVMTADDRTAEGAGRARQNVVHEIGLFQGRYDFNRVILLQQAGTEDFSNIAGLQTIPFNQRVEEGFYDLDRAIRKLQGE